MAYKYQLTLVVKQSNMLFMRVWNLKTTINKKIIIIIIIIIIITNFFYIGNHMNILYKIFILQ